MTLFRLLPDTPPIHIKVSDTLTLRSPQLADFDQWSKLRGASRLFLTQWEPVWPVDDLTRDGYRRRVVHYEKERLADHSAAVFLFSQPDDVLLGGIVLSHIRRGIAQVGTLGYWIGAPYAGKGWMTAGLGAFCAYAFEKLHLERLEAAAQPHNTASIKLLRRLGFRQEGLAEKYLRIAGERRDHLLFALLPEDLKKSKTA